MWSRIEILNPLLLLMWEKTKPPLWIIVRVTCVPLQGQSSEWIKIRFEYWGQDSTFKPMKGGPFSFSYKFLGHQLFLVKWQLQILSLLLKCSLFHSDSRVSGITHRRYVKGIRISVLYTQCSGTQPLSPISGCYCNTNKKSNISENRLGRAQETQKSATNASGNHFFNISDRLWPLLCNPAFWVAQS